MTDNIPSDLNRWIRPVSALILFAAFLVLLRVLPLEARLQPLFGELEDLGTWGPILFLAAGVILVLCFVPVSIPVSLSGFFFGTGTGFLISSGILLGGTCLGTLTGSWLWPRLKQKTVFQNPWFQAVRRVMKQEGMWIVFLLRMTPFFHFMTGNMFLGSLRPPWIRYLVFSYLGMIPGTLLMVYAGNIAGETLLGEADLSILQTALFGLGVLVFTGISLYITQRTRQELEPNSSTEN